MRLNASAGMMTAVALCAAVGCVKKTNGSQQKSIVNEDTKEELVEKTLHLPILGDAAGNVPADASSVRAADLRSTAYCFASVGKDGNPVGYVTSNYVFANEVWDLIDGVTAGKGESMQNISAAQGNELAAAATGVAVGGGAVGTALALTEGSAVVPANVVNRLRDKLVEAHVVGVFGTDGTLSLFDYNEATNKVSVRKWRGAEQVGGIEYLEATDARVKGFFSRTSSFITNTVDAKGNTIGTRYRAEFDSRGNISSVTTQSLVKEDGKIIRRTPVNSFSADKFKLGFRDAKKVEEYNKIVAGLSKNTQVGFSAPPLTKESLDANFAAYVKHAEDLHAGAKGAAAARTVLEGGTLPVGQVDGVTTAILKQGVGEGGKMVHVPLEPDANWFSQVKNNITGLARKCVKGELHVRLACVAGVGATGVGLYVAAKSSGVFGNGSSTPTGGKPPANAPLPAANALPGDEAIADEQVSRMEASVDESSAGTGASTSGTGVNATLSSADFEKITTGLALLAAGSKLPSCN